MYNIRLTKQVMCNTYITIIPLVQPCLQTRLPSDHRNQKNIGWDVGMSHMSQMLTQTGVAPYSSFAFKATNTRTGNSGDVEENTIFLSSGRC